MSECLAKIGTVFWWTWLNRRKVRTNDVRQRINSLIYFIPSENLIELNRFTVRYPLLVAAHYLRLNPGLRRRNLFPPVPKLFQLAAPCLEES